MQRKPPKFLGLHADPRGGWRILLAVLPFILLLSVYLIASEAIASQDGLGYRVFLVRRYLSMDMIIIYVAWITTVAYCFDFGLRKWVAFSYPWYNPKADG
jgi:NitT/TauT family transport system permease protein